MGSYLNQNIKLNKICLGNQKVKTIIYAANKNVSVLKNVFNF